MLYRLCGVFLLNSEINANRKRKMSVHETNNKRTENNVIFNFLYKLREDKLKVEKINLQKFRHYIQYKLTTQ